MHHLNGHAGKPLAVRGFIFLAGLLAVFLFQNLAQGYNLPQAENFFFFNASEKKSEKPKKSVKKKKNYKADVNSRTEEKLRAQRRQQMRNQLANFIREVVAKDNLTSPAVSTESEDKSLPGLNFGGSLLMEYRADAENPYAFNWRELRLELNAEATVTEQTHFYANCWFRDLDFADPSSVSNNVFKPETIQPWNSMVREAYFDVYNLGLDGLDLRLGRQRIAWGRGDQINPTDNVNPYDLENILDLRHLGSDAAKLIFHQEDFILTFIYIPIFTPSVLPPSAFNAIFQNSNLSSLFMIKNQEATLILPENKPDKCSSLAFKAETMLFGYNLSLSYFEGRSHFPLPLQITVVPTIFFPPEVDLQWNFAFPGMKILGMDLAGTLGPFGVWAEAALFYPEESMLLTDLTLLGLGKNQQVILDEPFLKYLLGMDHNFGGGTYANLQFLHGFAQEYGNENLKDYVFLNFEWEIANSIKIIPLRLVLEIKNFTDIRSWEDFIKHYGLMGLPALKWAAMDNVSLELGLVLYYGDPQTDFGQRQGHNSFLVKMMYQF